MLACRADEQRRWRRRQVRRMDKRFGSPQVGRNQVPSIVRQSACAVPTAARLYMNSTDARFPPPHWQKRGPARYHDLGAVTRRLPYLGNRRVSPICQAATPCGGTQPAGTRARQHAQTLPCVRGVFSIAGAALTFRVKCG